MTPCRRPRPFLALALAGLAPVSGCSGQNALLSGGTTVGSLRTSVSHLQFENEQLKRQVADLKADKRQVEDQLVQEEARNGDLTARLDDARQALRGRGLEGSTSSLDPEPLDPPQRALPAGQSNRKKRKPPFAQIPGHGADSGASDDEGATDGDSRENAAGPQSWRGEGDGWLPVARAPLSPVFQVR